MSSYAVFLFPHSLMSCYKSLGVSLSVSSSRKAPLNSRAVYGFSLAVDSGWDSINWASRTGGRSGSQASPGLEPVLWMDWTLLLSFLKFPQVLKSRFGEVGKRVRTRKALVSLKLSQELNIMFSCRCPTGGVPGQRLHLPFDQGTRPIYKLLAFLNTWQIAAAHPHFIHLPAVQAYGQARTDL